MEGEKKMEERNMNEFEVRYELRKKRKDIKTFEELVAYLEDVKNNYNYDYGVAPRAMAQALLAVGYHLASDFGITGFQASFVMWDFILDWQLSHNKCGARLVDFDNMLYPQYDYKFEKTISENTWQKLQEAAKENLEKHSDGCHPGVIAHWESIVNGQVPFGYTVSKD